MQPIRSAQVSPCLRRRRRAAEATLRNARAGQGDPRRAGRPWQTGRPCRCSIGRLGRSGYVAARKRNSIDYDPRSASQRTRIAAISAPALGRMSDMPTSSGVPDQRRRLDPRQPSSRPPCLVRCAQRFDLQQRAVMGGKKLVAVMLGLDRLALRPRRPRGRRALARLRPFDAHPRLSLRPDQLGCVRCPRACSQPRPALATYWHVSRPRPRAFPPSPSWPVRRPPVRVRPVAVR